MPNFEFLPTLLSATVVTIEIMVTSALFAVPFAFVLGITRVTAPRPLQLGALAIIEFFRGVSALVLLFWFFFALPLLGISLNPMTCAVLGLGLNAGAYGAEIVRGAIQSVPRSQVDAAVALNLTRTQTLVRIVLPQALVVMLPPFGNLMIELLKGTALVSMITITDLAFRAVQLNATYLRTVEVFTQVLLIYFVLALLVTGVMRLLERRLTRRLVGS